MSLTIVKCHCNIHLNIEKSNAVDYIFYISANRRHCMELSAYVDALNNAM